MKEYLKKNTPYALVNLEKLQKNIDKVGGYVSSCGVKLRPHVKTHKSAEIARMQTNNYRYGIMVSTFAEAHFFANDGCRDIVYGVPISQNKFGKAIALSKNMDAFSVIIDTMTTAIMLNDYCKKNSEKIKVHIKIDTGYHRCGVDPESESAIDLAKFIHQSEKLEFSGLISHSGHSYNSKSTEVIQAIGRTEAELAEKFSRKLLQYGVSCPEISIGSTPTISCRSSLEGVTEARPGNYVFYDCMQAEIGSCTYDEIALSVISSVISHHPEEGKAIIDAGSIALSKDIGDQDIFNSIGFGIVWDDQNGRAEKRIKLARLSQEHGIVTGFTREMFERYPIGSYMKILPMHSCLTASNHSHYIIESDGKIESEWKTCKGW